MAAPNRRECCGSLLASPSDAQWATAMDVAGRRGNNQKERRRLNWIRGEEVRWMRMRRGSGGGRCSGQAATSSSQSVGSVGSISRPVSRQRSVQSSGDESRCWAGD